VKKLPQAERPGRNIIPSSEKGRGIKGNHFKTLGKKNDG
jgi:hypothetical protein